MTKEVKKAIKHVKKHFPTLSCVIFTQGRWCYMDSDFNSFTFGNRINVSILEELLIA